MNKADLIQKIKLLEGITQDERSYLINLVNTKKKYGLVWEDKPEEVEEQLRTQLPILREVVEKRIKSGPRNKKSELGFLGLNDLQDSKKSTPLQTSLFEADENQNNQQNKVDQSSDIVDSPNHILIEGDNLHALTALSFTHEGKIDVIYIDPPYNTGNKDFKYNDSYVDKEDSYRHSKWLSFMDKRLRIAKRLLSEKGVIFISIDDNEQAQLKLLCDEILGTENFISNIANINNPKGRSDDKYIATAHEYILIYRKTNQLKMGGFEPEEKITKRYTKNDDNGIYRDIDLRKTGDGDTRRDRPNMFYPFYYNSLNGDFFATDIEDSMPEGYVSILPIKSSTVEGRWRWGLENSKANISKLVPKYMPAKKQWTVFEKDYLEKRDSIKSTSVWDFKDVNSERGTELFIKDLGFEKGSFQNPKPIGTLNRVLKISTNKTAIILDFFAGSGTTLHSTMQLNAGDGGNRQCILVTNNENNICEEVTYERNRRVIQGYTNSKGEEVPGLTNNNLRYYKSEFVGREPSLKNKRAIVRMATELLCIKEDCYDEKTLGFDFISPTDRKSIRFFEEKDKRVVIIYDDSAIESAVELIKFLISNHQVKENGIKVYVFSPGQYPFTEEFEEVLPYISLCALPDALYKAFMNVLPKKNRPIVLVLEEEAETPMIQLVNRLI